MFPVVHRERFSATIDRSQALLVRYNAMSARVKATQQDLASMDPHHSHFLRVDNGVDNQFLKN